MKSHRRIIPSHYASSDVVSSPAKPPAELSVSKRGARSARSHTEQVVIQRPPTAAARHVPPTLELTAAGRRKADQLAVVERPEMSGLSSQLSCSSNFSRHSKYSADGKSDTSATRQKPEYINRAQAQQLVPWWVLVLCVLVVLGFALLCVLLARAEDENFSDTRSRAFQNLAADALVAIDSVLDQSIMQAKLISRFIAMRAPSGNLTFEEFTLFNAAIMDTSADQIQAIEWVPRVKHEDRAAFEAKAERDLANVTGITWPPRMFARNSSDSSQLIPTPAYDEYFPVYYVNPLVGNEAAVMFAPGTGLPARTQAINASRDTAEPAGSEAITLLQSVVPESAILLFDAVYEPSETRHALDVPTVQERRDRLAGLVLMILKTNKLIRAVTGVSPEHISVRVLDVTGFTNCPVQLLVDARWGENGVYSELPFYPADQNCDALQGDRERMKRAGRFSSHSAWQPVSFSGRQWEVFVLRGDGFDTGLSSSRIIPLLVVASGIVVCGLALLFGLLWRGSLIIQANREYAQISHELQVEAEGANHQKTAFFAFLCHELRNPLHAVVAAGDEIEEAVTEFTGVDQQPQLPHADAGQPRGVPALQRELQSQVGVIQACSSLMTTIISDVLDLNKLEQGKLDFECLNVNLPRLIAKVQQMFSSLSASKSIDLGINVSDAMPRVWTDPTRVTQVLANFCSNAIKFTPEHGTVEIFATVQQGKVEDCEEPLRPSDDETRHSASDVPGVPTPSSQDQLVSVTIGVRDSGQGISPRTLPFLFQPYRQANAKVARKSGGTGLGLAIIRHITLGLGGFIDVETKEREGSVFSVTFPAYVASAKVSADRSERSEVPTSSAGSVPTGAPMLSPLDWEQSRVIAHNNQGSRAAANGLLADKTVLVVDDNDINCRLLGRSLKRICPQCTVDFGYDGSDAIEAVKPDVDKYDLVFMDVNMPSVNGLDATRVLRSLGCTAPIVAVTANAMASDRRQCFDAGMTGFMSKPFRKDDVREIVVSVLSSDDTDESLARAS